MTEPISPALRLERLTVEPARVFALVRVCEPLPLRTSAIPGFAQRLLDTLPGLRRHACDNDAGLTFAQELADTELPHALEHVAEELMALSGSPRTLRGETSWDFATDGRGVFRVVLEYDDDLVALGALKAARELLEALATGEATFGIEAEVERLRVARRR